MERGHNELMAALTKQSWQKGKRCNCTPDCPIGAHPRVRLLAKQVNRKNPKGKAAA